MDIHPIDRPITVLRVTAEQFHAVGNGGVTRIEATSKPGLHCDIPYVRVWAGDQAVAEYCQHHVLGVVFEG